MVLSPLKALKANGAFKRPFEKENFSTRSFHASTSVEVAAEPKEAFLF